MSSTTKVLVPLATGCEELEAVTIIDRPTTPRQNRRNNRKP